MTRTALLLPAALVVALIPGLAGHSRDQAQADSVKAEQVIAAVAASQAAADRASLARVPAAARDSAASADRLTSTLARMDTDRIDPKLAGGLLGG
jgi:selenophosphate synthase